MSLILDIIRLSYQLRLARHNIPVDPSLRTADQQQAARDQFWAVTAEVLTDVGTLAQAAVEVK